MLADLLPFQQLILRICSKEGKFYGLGCLLKPDQAITCAHVVADALGYDCDIDFIPPGKVQINQPFANDNTRFVTAQVKKRFPRDGHPLSDMALLQLDEPLTESIAIKLSYAVNLNGIRFQAWGGPKGHEINLIPTVGTIGNQLGNGHYELNIIPFNYKIEEGFNGAPVVDIETGQILGLIAQKEKDLGRITKGFLIPAVHWRQTGWFPELDAGTTLEVLKTWIKNYYKLHFRKHQPTLSTALNPLITWIKNHYKLRFRERQRLEAFIAYYAGTPTEPIPFAGRTKWLQQLDQWLAQDQSRFLLLSGSAGRGKSALLLHWLARIIPQQPDLAILFLPISIRFETSNELEGLRLLHAALCDYFPPYWGLYRQKPDTHDYRKELFSHWENIANESKQRYLLVIDGIDESTHNWLLKQVLPTDLPANLHLLLSARYQPGETNGISWLRALNLNGKILELPPLTPPAITEAIVQLGYPLDKLTDQKTFVKQIYRLTNQGEPLLLTLWIGQIWQHHEATPQIEQLQQLKPSLASFYQIWVTEQQKIWKTQALEISSTHFNSLMEVFALAYGPLLELELIALLEQMSSLVAWKEVKLREILTTASRLVVGDGETQGFSLIHPSLNEYFQAELAKNPTRRQQVDEAYLNWGAQIVADLNQGRLMPEQCPHYLLRHYTKHLVAARLEPRLALEKYWLPLIEGSGWHQAWEAYEGTWSGFLSDLQLVIQVLRQYHQFCDKHGERTAMKLAAEVRCALIRASIHELDQDFPTTLVIQLVKAEIWSLSKAEQVIAQFENEKQVDCLVELAKMVLQLDQERLLQQTITAVESIYEEGYRAKALITLSSLLADQPHLLQPALSIAENIQDEVDRTQVLTALAPGLAGNSHLLQRALTTVGNIHFGWHRSQVLTALASQLVGEPRQQILQQALTILTITGDIRYERHRGQALIPLVSQLVGEPRQQAWQQTLIAAENVQGEESRAKILTALVSQFAGTPPRRILKQALIATEKVWNKGPYAKILTTLVSYLVGEPRQQVLKQALIAVENLQSERCRVEALAVLVPQLTGELRQQVLQQALTGIENIQGDQFKDGLDRTKALAALVSHLVGESPLLQQALIIVENIQCEENRAQSLSILVPYLAGESHLLQQALTVAENIRRKKFRANTLIALASQLTGERRQQVLQQVLTITRNTQDSKFFWRANILATLAPHLAGEPHLLQQALAIFQNIQDEWERAQVLTKLASWLVGELRQQVLQQALIAMENLPENEEKLSRRDLIEKEHFKFFLIARLNREEPTITDTTQIQNNPDLLTYAVWADWLEHAPLQRSELFEVTGKLCAAAMQLTGNPQEANEIARAVGDVAKWWP